MTAATISKLMEEATFMFGYASGLHTFASVPYTIRCDATKSTFFISVFFFLRCKMRRRKLKENGYKDKQL
jgi:hypothetical protein